jgi:hypothetical protein
MAFVEGFKEYLTKTAKTQVIKNLSDNPLYFNKFRAAFKTSR